MGCFDTLSGHGLPCPTCGDQYWVDVQIKFFSPFGELGFLSPGESFERRDFEATELDVAEQVDDEWLRLRPSTRPGAVSLLPGWWASCPCGAVLGAIAHLSITPVGHKAITVRMDTFELADMRLFGSLCRVDFIDDEWRYATEGWLPDSRSLASLTALTHHERRERVAGVIGALVPSQGTEGVSYGSPGVSLGGAVRCEVCHHARTILDAIRLHDVGDGTLLGAAPPDGPLVPGARLTSVPVALSTDRHRARFTRLREPAPDGLTLLASGHGRGCRCGAGRASTLARFVREGADLVLDELRWRVVTRVEHLADVDWLEGGLGGSFVRSGQVEEDQRMHRFLTDRDAFRSG